MLKSSKAWPIIRYIASVEMRDLCIKGDMVMASAHSSELPGFGIKVGLANYAACYATGLLLARRILKKLKLDETYQGTDEVNGEYFEQEEAEDEEAPRPFVAYLDVGLARCSAGAKVFGCLKGAVDGGIAIPHKERRFPGWDEEENALDAEVHRKYIFGGHVQEYMEYLEEEDAEAYKRQFSQFIKAGVGADDLEGMYEAGHAAIRANPDRKPKDGKKHNTVVPKRKTKLSRQQRQGKVKQRLQHFHLKLAAAE